MSRARRAILASVPLIGVLFLFVLPGRTYLAQRHDLAAAQTRIDVLAKENAALGEQARMLQTDAEVERLARQQYGLVKPGEEAYAILPPKPPPTTAPPPPPAHHGAGLLRRMWHGLEFWRP